MLKELPVKPTGVLFYILQEVYLEFSDIQRKYRVPSPIALN